MGMRATILYISLTFFTAKFFKVKKRRKEWSLDNKSWGHYIPLSHYFIILNVIIYDIHSLSKKNHLKTHYSVVLFLLNCLYTQ